MKKDDFEFLEDLEEAKEEPENFESGDLYEDNQAEEDLYEEDLELEENIKLSPKKIAIFCGIFVLAVLICIPLWMLTHAHFGKDKEEGTEESVIGETLAEGPEEPTTPPTEPANEPVEPSASREPEATPSSGEENNTPSSEVQPSDDAQTPEEPVSGDKSMSFTDYADTVTAKDVTNLRSAPSTEDSENVVGQLKNGETLNRTGYNGSTGWSRLDYNGQTVYAVTQYLTEDLTYKPPVKPSNPNRVSTQDGRIIIFTDWDDYITPKEYVNLRTEPSTSEGETTVRCQVNNGEKLHRTGYSADSGWSRVEYNGESLYVVSSLTMGVAAE